MEGSPVLIRLLLLLLIACAPAFAQNQQELNAQAQSDFVKADAELNRVYKLLMKKASGSTKEQLITAQLAWIKFRDAEAKARASENEGGSIYPMIYSGSRARTTRARTAELQKWLSEWDGH